MNVNRPAIRPARATVAPTSFAVPHGSWDTHAHVFGAPEFFPQSPTRRYDAPTQDVDRYLAVLDALGIAYGVLVQPSVYGRDNSCLLHALDHAPTRLVGVVDIDVHDETLGTLESMSRRGVVGLRVQWGHGRDTAELVGIAARLAHVGWHLDLRVESIDEITVLAEVLAHLPVPVMIESMGSPRAGESTSSRGFTALLELLTGPDRYVKLSHAYQIDPDGPPYVASAPFARTLVRHSPDRLVWGSDWPHPMRPDEELPDDGALLDLVVDWAGDLSTATKILHINPTNFYRPLDQRPLDNPTEGVHS
ncbi:putative amidohydrolase [Gordonia polyisoprenivorans VH2]|uniref:Putative amidohydrolase n=1 Tax=Gordonia polyisoprenivorans (strain DSM 44266 / VH2) TaxID=1112204 RepID=H6MZ67_GORPV|nr:amidohydrolase family protein [Gordonia polyisoprenivorans]AFA74403.1 putative amidohydrolase [Gordonia polyisoprenivorans VH2]